MDVNSQQLIAVFDMINERLYSIEKSQKTMMTHLKNKCIKERKFDKDLFGYPMNVCLVDKQHDIKSSFYTYVSLSLFDFYDVDHHSIYNKDFFDEIKHFIPSILNAEQNDAVTRHINHEDDDKENMCCVDIGIHSIYKYINDYILNKHVKNIENKVVMIIPTHSQYYDIILKGLDNIDDCVTCCSQVYHALGLRLDKLHSFRNHINIIVCPSKLWLNFEILLSIDELNKQVIEILKVKKNDVERYCSYIKRLQKEGYIQNHCHLDDSNGITLATKTMKSVLSLFE